MEKIKKIVDTIRVIIELVGFIKDFIEEYQDGIIAVIEKIKEIWKKPMPLGQSVEIYEPREAKEEYTIKNRLIMPKEFIEKE